MLNKHAQDWVADLRSGKFTQTTGRLTGIYLDDTDGIKVIGNCCLGVACERFITENPGVLEIDNTAVTGEGQSRSYSGEESFLPAEVIDWLGLRSSGGEFYNSDGDYSQLYNLNDDGMSFSDLADIIEAEPEGLFKS